MKKLDLSKNVNDLLEQYPELLDVLKDLGFKAITNPLARKTLGRMTTIPGACKIHKKNLNEIVRSLKERGFEIEGLEQ